MAEINALESKKSAVIGTFTGKCCDANVFNNNDMHLSADLFNNLFNSEDYQRAIKNKYYIGFLGHPEDPGCMDFRNACIVMTEGHLDDNGEVYGTFDLVDTPVGQVVKAFIDAGVTFGISIRGAGDVDGEGNVDPDTFVFRGFDLVTFPAYDDCVPTFKEIAASSDIDKQVKCKKVKNVIRKNLSKITSCEALEVIGEQLRDGSEEFNQVADRINELDNAEDEDRALEIEVLQEKLDGVTELYTQEVKKTADLENKVDSMQLQCNETELMCSRKIKSFTRIANAQIADLKHKCEVTASDNQKLKEAVSELRSQKVEASRKIKKLEEITAARNEKLSTLRKDNLKYVHKIEATSTTISQKDSAIEDLKNRLNETVVANESLKSKASNLDDSLNELSSRVEAAEQLIVEYQQAYANMYANALGVHLENMSVTASTTVAELQDMICAGTSTANIAVNPSMDTELLDENEIDSSEFSEFSDIVTL